MDLILAQNTGVSSMGEKGRREDQRAVIGGIQPCW